MVDLSAQMKLSLAALSGADSETVWGGTVLRDLGWLLPELATPVPCPAVTPSLGGAWCDMGHVGSISHMIQHLNDHWGWTREQIADWLDTLDADLTFPTEPPPRPEPPRRAESHGYTHGYTSLGYTSDEMLSMLVNAKDAFAAASEKFTTYKMSVTLSYAKLDVELMKLMTGVQKKYDYPLYEWQDEYQSAPSWAWTGAKLEEPEGPELPVLDPLRDTAEFPFDPFDFEPIMYDLADKNYLALVQPSPPKKNLERKRKDHGYKHAA